MSRTLWKLVAAATLCWLALAAKDASGAELTLRLHDGSRVFVGEVAAVDDSTLTVAAVGERIRIERTISWNRIAGASLDAESYSLTELRLALGMSPVEASFVSHVGPMSAPIVSGPQADAGISPCSRCAFAPRGCLHLSPCAPILIACRPFFDPFRPVGRVIGVRSDPLSAYADLAPGIYPNGIPSTEAPFALGLLRERRRVETISPFVTPIVPPAPVGPIPPLPAGDVVPGELSQIEARVTPLRLGGGADVSALGVTLIGFDAAGRPVPVEGTAQFFLYAGRQRLVRAFDNVYAAEPERLIRLGEWTRAVLPDASLVLRLPEPLPDHDPTVTAIGSLRVRLSMPGQGVFETVAEPIALRPASPLRDAIRGETGSRFLPNEKTTGRRVETWPRRRD